MEHQKYLRLFRVSVRSLNRFPSIDENRDVGIAVARVMSREGTSKEYQSSLLVIFDIWKVRVGSHTRRASFSSFRSSPCRTASLSLGLTNQVAGLKPAHQSAVFQQNEYPRGRFLFCKYLCNELQRSRVPVQQRLVLWSSPRVDATNCQGS